MDIGRYRTHDDLMQVISGRLDKQTVHFEAPPSSQMDKEMKVFVSWFNDIHTKNRTGLLTLAKAGMVHYYFLAIHPFEDGNGHIARGLSEKSISMELGRPVLISLSQTIESDKKAYYNALAVLISIGPDRMAVILWEALDRSTAKYHKDH